mmetsp:Transcript_85948/g.128749  ORF Transcript_85948/g.128749 Transcript_85948/m.128749 type:complete len:131 (+) Transcript_85948:19-411(+)
MLRRSLCGGLRFSGSFSCGSGRVFDQQIVQKRTGMFDSIADLVEKSGGMDRVKELMQREFEGKSDDGLVVIALGGDDSVARISIDPSLLKRDVSVVERGVKEAIGRGLKAKQSAMISEMMNTGKTPPKLS